MKALLLIQTTSNIAAEACERRTLGKAAWTTGGVWAAEARELETVLERVIKVCEKLQHGRV